MPGIYTASRLTIQLAWNRQLRNVCLLPGYGPSAFPSLHARVTRPSPHAVSCPHSWHPLANLCYFLSQRYEASPHAVSCPHSLHPSPHICYFLSRSYQASPHAEFCPHSLHPSAHICYFLSRSYQASHHAVSCPHSLHPSPQISYFLSIGVMRPHPMQCPVHIYNIIQHIQ